MKRRQQNKTVRNAASPPPSTGGGGPIIFLAEADQVFSSATSPINTKFKSDVVGSTGFAVDQVVSVKNAGEIFEGITGETLIVIGDGSDWTIMNKGCSEEA